MAEGLTTVASRLFQKRVISPVIHLLRVGACPRRLAWSLAVGVAVGINPLLGSTTLVCLAVAFVLRLNLVASQVANHLVYPLQLAMFFVFLNLGNRLFHTSALPLGKDALLAGMRRHPLETTRTLWVWEWHALVVWGVAAIVITPILVAVLTPVLTRLLVSLQNETGRSKTVA